MLFDVDVSKLAADGHFVNDFISKYEDVRDLEGNPAWNLINKYPV